MVKDILKCTTDYDLVCVILLSRNENNFDARRLSSAISDSSKKHKELGRLFERVGPDGSVPSTFCHANYLDNMLSVLRMGGIIYQYQDELCTERYYLRRGMHDAIARYLEERLGNDLKKLEPVAREIWTNYASKIN